MQLDKDRDPKTDLLNRTEAFCIDCGESHPAVVERVGDEVFFESRCPQGAKRTRISSDADLFLGIRGRGVLPATGQESPTWQSKWTYVVEVTNDCGFACPVCLNPRLAGEARWHMSAADLGSLVVEMSRHGRRSVILTGGEPTRHPDLFSLVRTLRKRRFRVSLATNGMRLAQERGYARALRRAGVGMVFVQMDTLDADVHVLMRGNRFVPDKIRAVEQSIDAGLRVAFVVTATRATLATLDDLLRYALTLGPALSLVDIHVAAPVGRFSLPSDQLVDREEVVRALLDCPVLQGGLQPEHVRPPMTFHPWQSSVHPDCSASAILLVNRGQPRPIDDLVDMDSLCQQLAANRMGSSFWSRNLVPLDHLLAAAKSGQRLRVLRHLWGMLRRRGRRGVLAIMVNDLMGRECLDQARLARCTTCVLSAHGGQPGCLSCWLKPILRRQVP